MGDTPETKERALSPDTAVFEDGGACFPATNSGTTREEVDEHLALTPEQRRKRFWRAVGGKRFNGENN